MGVGGVGEESSGGVAVVSFVRDMPLLRRDSFSVAYCWFRAMFNVWYCRGEMSCPADFDERKPMIEGSDTTFLIRGNGVGKWGT